MVEDNGLVNLDMLHVEYRHSVHNARRICERKAGEQSDALNWSSRIEGAELPLNSKLIYCGRRVGQYGLREQGDSIERSVRTLPEPQTGNLVRQKRNYPVVEINRRERARNLYGELGFRELNRRRSTQRLDTN